MVVMADNDKEESNSGRWLTQPGELFIIDPDTGTRTRIGEPSAETLEYAARLKAELAAKLALQKPAGDSRARTGKRGGARVRVHIHR
jgi:hypothetical protein